MATIVIMTGQTNKVTIVVVKLKNNNYEKNTYLDNIRFCFNI